MASAGMELLSSLIATNDTKIFLSLGLRAELFKPSEQVVYELMDQHIKQYGTVPALSTVLEATEYDETDFPEVPEPPEFYLERVEKRFINDNLKVVLAETKTLLLEQQPEAALQLMTDKVVDLSIRAHPMQIVDFRESLPIIHKEYKAKLAGGDDYGIKMGWDYLDDMSGGLFGGDMFSYVGRPAMGKTFQLLYSGHNAWFKQTKRTLIVSMEMIPLLLLQRLAAMHTSTGLSAIKNSELSTKGYAKFCQELSLVKDHGAPMWIVNGNLSSTVDDIWRLCRQLKPELVLVDGAYLVKTKQNMGKFDRIGYVAEALKSQIATDLSVPVVATYQFNRDVAKKAKKKGHTDEAGLEDIYGSDVIGQVSSVVLALLEDDSIETIKRRRVDILKGRSGEVGHFFTNWDFHKMDFRQWVEPKLEELQFI